MLRKLLVATQAVSGGADMAAQGSGSQPACKTRYFVAAGLGPSWSLSLGDNTLDNDAIN